MSYEEPTQPISPAFARRARSAALLVLLFTTTLFGVFSHGLVARVRDESLQNSVQMLSASLPPNAGQAHKEAVARAVRQHEKLLVVATLDAFGSVSAIYPNRLAHRETLERLLLNAGEPTRTTSPDDGTSCILSAVAVPFGSEFSLTNASLVAVMRVDSPVGQWLTAISMFTIIVAVVAWYSTWSLYRWFDSQVVDPLRRMASIVGDPDYDAQVLRSRRICRWRETAEIVVRFEELRSSLNQTLERAKRYRRDAKQTLRDCEVGYDRQLQHARFLAQTDPLTKLRNRAFLDEQLESVFTSQRDANGSLAVVMVDLDNFKAFNDTLGHQVGDALLKFTGALLSGSIRPSDYALRYGGDEFMLLLPGADARQASIIADRIIKMFGQYASRLEKGDMVSMSAGVASAPETQCVSGLELIAAADKALYLAKRSGKSKVQVIRENGRPRSPKDPPTISGATGPSTRPAA